MARGCVVGRRLERPLRLLRGNLLVSNLSEEELARLVESLETVEVDAGQYVVREGERGRSLFFVLAGAGRLERGGIRLQDLSPGESFGELGLLTDKPRAASIIADEAMTLASLSWERWQRLTQEQPSLALKLLSQLVAGLGTQLIHATDNVGLLLRERSLPRRTQLHVEVAGQKLKVPTGTPTGVVLPAEEDGALVVAALVDSKPVPLSSPLTADGKIEPLSVRSWEGREVYRRSAGLVLLEAATRLADPPRLRIGPSLSSAQLLEFVDNGSEHLAPARLEELARQLTKEMAAIIKAGTVFVEELWTVEEAATHLAAQGWLGIDLGPHLQALLVGLGILLYGFAAAVQAAAEGGFAPIRRLAGGRAAVFHETTFAFSWTLPDANPVPGVRPRFALLADIIKRGQKQGVFATISTCPSST